MKRKGKGKGRWVRTAVGDTEVVATAGACSLQIRLQHDFRAYDLTFEGSSASSTCTSIFFGDRVVWQSPNGISTSVFDVQGFMRKFLKGQGLRSGLDITVNGTVANNGDTFAATIIGDKPLQASTC